MCDYLDLALKNTLNNANKFESKGDLFGAASTNFAASLIAAITFSCKGIQTQDSINQIKTLIDKSRNLIEQYKKQEGGDADIAKSISEGIIEGFSKMSPFTPSPTSAPSPPSAPSNGTGREDKCPTDFKPIDRATIQKDALSFDEIIGLDEAKSIIVQSVVIPMKYKDIAISQNLRPPNVLLYGPGGTGKTTLVKAISKDTGTDMLNVAAGEIKGKFVGQTEKCIKEMIDVGIKLNVIVFVDEIDSILGGDSDIEKNAQSAFKQVVQTDKPPVVMGATNIPWFISDDAIQRRFGLKLYVSLPTPSQRKKYLEMLAGRIKDCFGKPQKLELSDNDWKYILDKTRGFSPDDLDRLFKSARLENPKSLPKEQNLLFCPSKKETGKWDPFLRSEVITDKNCKTLSELEAMDQSKNVCWPLAERRDFENAFKYIRASNSERTLRQFLEYAEKVRDEDGVKEIERTIKELNGDTTINVNKGNVTTS